MFSKSFYVVLGGKKSEDVKGKKMLEKENVTNAGRTTNKHKKGKIRHDKSSREYALALEMFYSDSIYDICGAS